MPNIANAAPRGKTPRHLKFRAPHPGSSRVEPPVDTGTAARAVYDGRDRLGSYRCCAGRWIAVDRLGHPLAKYSTEAEASNVVWAAGGSR